jgi:hypothetical protein
MQSPTSQRSIQSFFKELANPAQEKNFKFFLPRLKEKLKLANTRATQTENKMKGMTILI